MGIPEAGFAGAVILVNALGELIKKTPIDQYIHAWLPVILEVAGFGIGLALGLGWFASIFVGLSAMGLYSGGRATVQALSG